MVCKLEAGETQVPYPTDFIWLLETPELQDVRERGKPEESHVNQPKECKILKLFTFNNAEKKTQNKSRGFVAHSLYTGLKQKSAVPFP